jgi:hypothetical protein
VLMQVKAADATQVHRRALRKGITEPQRGSAPQIEIGKSQT